MTSSDHDHERDPLYERAVAAAASAYVPYSQFRVGAAVRTASGEVFTGCNVENASFGLTICAERVACAAAIAAGHTSIQAVAIHVEARNGQPCGACRQFLSEFGPTMRVMYRRDGDVIATSLDALLSDPFLPASIPGS